MKSNNRPLSMAALIGSAVITTAGLAGLAQADDETLFVATELESGYALSARGDTEGACGEGKCGASGEPKDGAEGKCGDGKTDSSGGKDTEGKCGEGKCGGIA